MKKFISILSVIAVLSISLVAVFSVSAGVAKYNLGDVKRDENIDISDATLVQSYIADIDSLDNEQLKLADVNRDEIISINDVTYIQSYISGFIDEFPDESPTEPSTQPTTLSVDSEGYYNIVVKP